ncbi:hypothetical protein CASFOL_018236 [Castilleja foliolosa]|uniref:Uncharacterized protein n=1 Tax=Castilleja foliolosa TaxID=1961234 RepID=A0ABD3D6U2_9LAMI
MLPAKAAGQIIRNGFYETKRVEHKGLSQKPIRNVKNSYLSFLNNIFLNTRVIAWLEVKSVGDGNGSREECGVGSRRLGFNIFVCVLQISSDENWPTIG